MAPLASARDPGYALESHVEETKVVFGAGIDDEVIRAYVRSREGDMRYKGWGRYWWSGWKGAMIM